MMAKKVAHSYNIALKEHKTIKHCGPDAASSKISGEFLMILNVN